MWGGGEFSANLGRLPGSVSVKSRIKSCIAWYQGSGALPGAMIWGVDKDN